ncbi:hypothetical protein [Candidatus Anaplasma sp. TIGMIC]|uniref:hypothetical protein n=1 Tax=Candidatus Anaplasma sp. TIGMIC TaxID=3020713 RepID=UPI00232ACB68|nr:hypothetical protein [Candidatus Anaplasma sp. TIGMIC]MDB1135068.1 hypothetical protein [Candidatus Anaplasma sp. TIGMIC]
MHKEIGDMSTEGITVDAKRTTEEINATNAIAMAYSADCAMDFNVLTTVGAGALWDACVVNNPRNPALALNT